MAEKQCAQAQQAVQEVEQAKSNSTELEAQLVRAGQALHSQQHFVMTLQAAADEAAHGESNDCNAGYICYITKAMQV